MIPAVSITDGVSLLVEAVSQRVCSPSGRIFSLYRTWLVFTDMLGFLFSFFPQLQV